MKEKEKRIATEVIRVTLEQKHFLQKLVPHGERGIYKGLYVLIESLEKAETLDKLVACIREGKKEYHEDNPTECIEKYGEVISILEQEAA